MVQRCCPIEPRIPEHDGERTRRLAALARALADETRLALLTVLLRHEAPLCVCHLVERLAVGQPTVSHHLQRLRRAGLVTVERRGTWAYYQATDLARAALAGLEQALFQRST